MEAKINLDFIFRLLGLTEIDSVCVYVPRPRKKRFASLKEKKKSRSWNRAITFLGYIYRINDKFSEFQNSRAYEK